MEDETCQNRIFTEFGKHLFDGKQFSYELFVRKDEVLSNKTRPIIVLLHGFGDKPSSLRIFAQKLATIGGAVLLIQLQLFGLRKSVLHKLRQKNIRAVKEFVEWLDLRTKTTSDVLYGLLDAGNVAFVGHSAGGAVAFEAACIMQSENSALRAVLLLDAVPWLSTLERAARGELKYESEKIRQDPSRCALMSIRCQRSDANAQGIGYNLLAISSKSFLDIEFYKARHADFVDNAWKKTLLRVLGLVSSQKQHDDLMLLSTSFLISVLDLEVPGEMNSYGAKSDSDMYLRLLQDKKNAFDMNMKTIDSSSVQPVDNKSLPFYLK